MISYSDKYDYAPTPVNSLDSLLPTAEDLAAKDGFGVSYTSTVATPVYQDIAAQYTPPADDTTPTSYQDIAAQYQEIPPVNTNPVQAFVTNPANKPVLIGAGVLLAVGAFYLVTQKKGKGAAKGGQK